MEPNLYFLKDSTIYNRRGCRNSVIQMISEKSLNCSMISLPPVTPNLPACGPMEGLALMYILREQGALVTTNSTVSNRLILIAYFDNVFNDELSKNQISLFYFS